MAVNRLLKQIRAFHRLQSGRANGRKYAVPLGNDSLGMASGEVLSDQIDTSRCTATFIISTRGHDRDGDTVEPKGCLATLDSYRKNPVVLYDHDTALKPIALSEIDGSSTLMVLDDQITATACFHLKTRESSETFELVAAKVLRAASIGFRPLDAQKITEAGKQVGWYFLAWELTEWSICPIGANADALRLHLDSGKVKSLSLRRTLEPFAAVASKSWANGADIVAKKKKKTKAEDAEDRDDETKGDDDIPEDEDADAGDTEDETPKDELRAGPHDLASLMVHVQRCCQWAETALNRNEHPPMRALLQGVLDKSKEELAALEELAGKEYPGVDFDSLKQQYTPAAGDTPAEDEDEDENPADEPMHKGKRHRATKVKRLNKASKSIVTDAKEFLDEMSDDDRVSKVYRTGCKSHAKALGDMLDGMDQPDKNDDPVQPMDEEEAKSLLAELTNIKGLATRIVSRGHA